MPPSAALGERLVLVTLAAEAAAREERWLELETLLDEREILMERLGGPAGEGLTPDQSAAIADSDARTLRTLREARASALDDIRTHHDARRAVVAYRDAS